MIYRFFPRRYVNWVRTNMLYAGMKSKPGSYINKTLLLSIVISVVIAFISGPAFLPYVFIGVFIGSFGFLNAWLILAVDRRKNFVERVLPDALELMAANIRAGYIPSKALLLSARSEFGPLADAIRASGREILTGKSFGEGLSQIPKYIKSEMLERTIKLIEDGSVAGGQLVSLLEENAIDIRRKQAIQKEVKANIMMYGIFIVFSGVLAAPVLYALSIYLITTLTAMGGDQVVSSTFSNSVPFFKFGVSISPDFLFLFSVASIMITTFFSGIIIGLIDTGKEKGGIKYVPLFMIMALMIFFGARILINSMFGSFLPS